MKINKLKNRSYVPYSNRSAAVLVQSTQDNFFPGVRIENISFPLAISAVQNALFCCMSEGHQPEVLFTENAPDNNFNLRFWINEFELNQKPIAALDGVSLQPVLQTFDEEQIVEKLQALLDNPRVKQSNFPVAALLETEKGFIGGQNIEPTRWNRGLCAERVAIAKAISYGVKGIKALHLTALHGEYSSPCGACRQVIIEHLPHHPVYLHDSDGTHAMHFSSDLMPYSFTSSKLKPPSDASL